MQKLSFLIVAGLSLAGATTAPDLQSTAPDLQSTAPTCKDDSGDDVDFAYAFKYPSGFDYAYMDSKTKLKKSSHTLDSASSSISQTIMQMHSSGVSAVLWNDQPPPSKDSGAPRAHAKGLLLFTSAGGIWLTHSLPHFPSTTGTSASSLWADGADDFGQAYLCITLTMDEINKLTPVMLITRPVVYYTKGTIPDAMATWADTTRPKHDDDTMTTSVSIESKGGQTFTFFGKSGAWGEGKDLYRDLVAPAEGDLEMEGWRRGAGVWDAACGKDQVLDILSVSFPEKDWITGDDHSKWAVAKTGTAFCVGDINRADGQDKRGGGTVCIKSSTFSEQMRKVIATTDKCKTVSIMV